ncbi:MAG: VWA domain-containing protein [Planctomycetes bacterium]|nr:VWA domain-containing protein [Planctomycetota bacterium]
MAFLRALLLVTLGAMVPAVRAQSAPSADEVSRLAAQALRAWVDDYERGRLAPHGVLRSGVGLQPSYVAYARRGGFVEERDHDRLNHLDVLQKVLVHAEHHPSADVADALLALAATGLEAAFLDHEALQLRDLGWHALLRSDHRGGWFVILRAAAGGRVPLVGDDSEDPGRDGLAVGPARRVAALRLLGQRALPVFRSTIEAALTDPDPRVRLGAVEALDLQRRKESLPRVVQVLESERHPVVAQALVRLLLALLRAEPGPDADVRAAALQVALRRIGQAGWRTDMELLDLVEAFPSKAVLPAVLDALELADRPPDKLVAAVNEQASPLLRQRAAGLLRAMTGALLPDDDPAAWRSFWQAERDRIVVPERLVQDRPEATRAQFFGVPVTGRHIVFVIDTSGSMDELAAGTEGERERRRGGERTRLRAAKEQLAAAVQAMPDESTFEVVTFAGEAKRWTGAAVRSGSRSLRSLTELTSRWRAHGGTNLYAALAEALGFERQRWADPGTGKVDEVFVLSDGEPTAGPVQDGDELLRLCTEANKYARIRIHAVFTGSGPGGELLRRLAEQNGGVFVQR